MTTAVLVDWLGRGGIAQTTEEWRSALAHAGVASTVVTRQGRELAGVTPRGDGGRVRAHAAVATLAARTIREQRPDLVVVQNYILPPIERPVYAAARAVGARTIVMIHDHRLHSLRAGIRLGLRASLRRADVVVALSRFVGEAVAAWSGRGVEYTRHPIHRTIVDAPVVPSPFRSDGDKLALHFGILKRGYKGTDTALGVAANAPSGWRIGLLGSGGPSDVPGVEVVSGYVENAVLAAALRGAAAAVLPYKFATQSGAVALTQALGSVPIASAVGGIPEQIEHGETGLLLRADAPVSEWVDALRVLDDDAERSRIAAQARAAAVADHDTFVADVQRLVSGR